MTKNNLFEVTLAMLPESKQQLSYNDHFILDDNFEDSSFFKPNYEGDPVKITFVVVVFCLKGKGSSRLNLQDFVFGENDLLVIPPGAIIDKMHLSDDCKLGTLLISDYHREYLPTSNLRMTLMTEIKNKPLIVHFNSQSMFHFVESYKKIRMAIEDPNLHYKEEVLAGYMQVMSACWINEMKTNKKTVNSPKISRDEQIFNLFIDEVRNNYSEHRDVSFYANQLHITAKYLGVVVTRVSGRRPLEWIRDHVILDAKAMVLSGNYTMQQISDILHFATPSFFGKYFRESVGCTPGKYAEKKSR